MPETKYDIHTFDQLWDYNDPAASEERFRDLLPQAADSPAFLAELLTQIARTHGLRREFESAHQILGEAETLLADAGPRARIRYLLERGRTFNSSGEKEQAGRLFLDAFELGRKQGEEALAIDAAHMLAIAKTGEEELEWNLKAAEMAAASTVPQARRWLGSLYNNIGWTYHGREAYETALDFFEKALEQRRKEGEEGNIRMAQWCVARCLRSLERLEEALQAQQALLAGYEAAGDEDGYVFEEIAECLLALDRPDEARPYFAGAHRLLSADTWLQAEEPERLARLESLAT